MKTRCNGNDVLGNVIEALRSHLHLRFDEHDSLSKHMEASEQRCNVMKEDRTSFANDKMRDGRVAELVSRNQ